MSCPLFLDGRLCRCEAVRGLLIPSLHERERFCRPASAHGACPTFRSFSATGAAISQDQYYELWSPEPVEMPPVPAARLAAGAAGLRR
jgi:hypothetical protein